MRRRQFLALFALGFVGVLSLAPAIAPLIASKPLPPDAPQLPVGVLVALSLVQPTVLMAIGVAIGLRLAPLLGLRSYIADAVATGAPIWPRFQRDVPIALAVAVAQMAVTLPLELAFRPFMGEAWRRLEEAENPLGTPLTALISGMLYGGITEELMIRWGVMSLFAWLVWRLAGRPTEAPPRSWIMWTAILVSAILFGLGHLPVLSGLVPLTPVVVVRTVLLNALAGIAFGWLFWQRSLEAAMVAHATGHVILFAVKLVVR
jgi:CAAX prenyl protease-like protein